MSATTVIRRQLVDSDALSALVPPARTFIGKIPLNTQLPALSIRAVSIAPRNTLSMAEAKRMVTDRVQVTVHARTYPEKDAILDLVRRAVSNVYGVVAGVQVRSIVPAGVGPDLDTDNPRVFTRSRDYKVSFIE